MKDFKLDLRIQMPNREPVMTECKHCLQMHDSKEECEGLGYETHQTTAYEVPQIEDSSYLQKALKRFRKKQKAKNVKDKKVNR